MLNLPKYGTEEYQQYKAEARQEHEDYVEAIKMKQDHEVRLAELELEVQKTEVSLKQMVKVPLTLLRLPVMLIASLFIGIAVVAGRSVPKAFWEVLD